MIETVGYHELYEQTLDTDLSLAFKGYLADWAARVLDRCDQDGVFNAIDRMPQFRAIVLDHDEEIETGLERIDRVRDERPKS